MQPSELDGYCIERPFTEWPGIDPADTTIKGENQMSNSPNVKTKTLFTYLCWAIFIAMTGITGCKMSVIPELYLTDLHDVAVNRTEGVSVPTTLLFQIPSSRRMREVHRPGYRGDGQQLHRVHDQRM